MKVRTPVQPITPEQAALLASMPAPDPVPAAPATWEEGDAQIIDLIEQVTADQQGMIEMLSDHVVDARGITGAQSLKTAELIARLDARDKIIDAQAETIRTLTKQVVDLAGEVDAMTTQSEKVHDSIQRVIEVAKEDREDFAKLAGEINEAVVTVNGAVDKLADIVGNHGTAITKGGELLTEVRGEVEAIARATDKVIADKLTPLAEQVTDLKSRVDSVEQTATDARDLFDTQAKHVGEISERITKLDDSFSAENKARVDAVNKLVEAVDDLAKTASEADAEIDTKVETLTKQVSAEVDAIDKRITAEGKIVQQSISEHSISAQNAIDVVGDKVDENAGLFRTVAQSHTETKAELEALGGRVSTIDKAVTDLTAETCKRIDAQAEAAQNAIDGLDDKLVDLRGIFDTQAKASVEQVARVDAQAKTLYELNDNVRTIDGEVKAIAKTQGQDALRISGIEEGVTKFVEIAVTTGREVREIDDKVAQAVTQFGDMHAQAREALARVTILTDQGPAAFHLDRSGHLIRTARNGEAVDMGKVIAEARDGADAPKMVATKIEDGRFIITLSDGTAVSCSVKGLFPPADPGDGGGGHGGAPKTSNDIDPTLLGYLSKDPAVKARQVDDMVVMRKAGKSYKQIAAKYGISERQAARLIKDAPK